MITSRNSSKALETVLLQRAFSSKRNVESTLAHLNVDTILCNKFTFGQITFFTAWFLVCLVWFAKYLNFLPQMKTKQLKDVSSDSKSAIPDPSLIGYVAQGSTISKTNKPLPTTDAGNVISCTLTGRQSNSYATSNECASIPCFGDAARSMIILGFIMLYFLLCDYIKVFFP